MVGYIKSVKTDFIGFPAPHRAAVAARAYQRAALLRCSSPAPQSPRYRGAAPPYGVARRWCVPLSNPAALAARHLQRRGGAARTDVGCAY